MPQGTKAYILAMGESHGQIVFGKLDFLTSYQQALDISPVITTREEMNAAINSLAIDRLTVQANDSKNAAAMRATDKQLSDIERLKPKDCDCDCGKPTDSVRGEKRTR